MTDLPVLTPDGARRHRLRAQGLLRTEDGGSAGRGGGVPSRAGPSPVDAVRAMIALQGQNLPAVLRAIAIRSRPGTGLDQVRAAFDAGELVRGWTQRGTLFATTPTNLAALMSLTAARTERQARKVREEREGLDHSVVAQAEAVALGPLAERGLTRAALTDLWRQAGVPVDGQQGYHLIAALALRGVLHWGPFEGAQQLMVATPPATFEVAQPDAVLRRLARSYVASRGPVTAEDLAWWLGLPKTPVRAAVAAVREGNGGDDAGGVDGEPPTEPLTEVSVEGRAMLATGTPDAWVGLNEPVGVILVPSFDEIMLGYQDRDLVVDDQAMKTVVPFVNGVFRPAVLVDGRVVGTWRRAPKKNEAPFELVPGIPARTRKAIANAVAAWPLG